MVAIVVWPLGKDHPATSVSLSIGRLIVKNILKEKKEITPAHIETTKFTLSLSLFIETKNKNINIEYACNTSGLAKFVIMTIKDVKKSFLVDMAKF